MLGGNYIGQAYLAQGYAGSTVTNGTGSVSGSFSASATGSAYLPASGSLTASFSASATGTAFLPSTGAVHSHVLGFCYGCSSCNRNWNSYRVILRFGYSNNFHSCQWCAISDLLG